MFDTSSRKEQRTAAQGGDTTGYNSTSTTATSTTSSSPIENNTQYRQTINRALDETKDNIRRSTDEARKEIPRYTQQLMNIMSKLFRQPGRWQITA